MRNIHTLLIAQAMLLLCPISTASAAPYIPQDESQILERLPYRAENAEIRGIKSLQQNLAKNQANADLSAELAERYYQQALRQGDPRYIGYAESVLLPWKKQNNPPAKIRLVRAEIAQFLHDFPSAKTDLDAILQAEPDHLGARAVRAILLLVQAEFKSAREDCRQLALRSPSLIAKACELTVRAINGEALVAYEALRTALQQSPQAPSNERRWVITRLAEIAQRLELNGEAEQHFQRAIALDSNDQYLLASYADFLLDQGQAQKAAQLLRGKERNDVLLFRWALAEKILRSSLADELKQQISERITAARQRGDKLHLADEASYELHFRHNAPAALKLAQENWASLQREPSDVRLLLETAMAAGDATAAAPAIHWMQETRHEDPRLRQLMARLQGKTP